MNRNNWQDVYKNQNALLHALSSIEPLIFAGGTEIHRVALMQARRESEDLDFFMEKFVSISESTKIADLIRKSILLMENCSIINYIANEDGTHRFFCQFDDNDEIIKIELLNFTGGRFFNLDYIKNPLFSRCENIYNLILYKIKALCDRHDTIKDLYDLFFLFREYKQEIPLRMLLADLSFKFKPTTSYNYGEKEIVEALMSKNRMWDIHEINIFDSHRDVIKEAIYAFRDELYLDIVDKESDSINLSWESYLQKKISMYDFALSPYEYLDTFEENSFAAAYGKFVLGKNI